MDCIANCLLFLDFFAFEEEEGDHMGNEIHLGDCLCGGEELREGLMVAADALVEICARVDPL